MIRNNLVDDDMSHHDDKDKDTDSDSVHKLKVNLTKNWRENIYFLHFLILIKTI